MYYFPEHCWILTHFAYYSILYTIYCGVVWRIVMYCSVLPCIVLNYITLYYIVCLNVCCIYCIIVQCFSSFISWNVIVFLLMFIWYNLVSYYTYTHMVLYYICLFCPVLYHIYIYTQHGFVLNGERNDETNNVVYSNTRRCFACICGLYTLTYYTCCFIVYVWTCFMVLVLI